MDGGRAYSFTYKNLAIFRLRPSEQIEPFAEQQPRTERIMRFGKTIILGIAGISLAISSATYAWSTDGHGNIRCGDGSNATVKQLDDGYWTATSAGKHGKVGGHFGIEGQAALYACGEG